MEAIITGLVQNGSDKVNIKLDKKLPKPANSYKELWIRITHTSNIDIRKIKEYNESSKSVILESEIRNIPNKTTKYDIGDFSKVDKSRYVELIVTGDDTKTQIKLNANAKKMDKIYNKYWIKVISGNATDNVRQIKEYKNNTLILDYDLSNNIKNGDKILLMSHYVNDYIMFGIIDFTNFIGMDFSSLIDVFGGLFNFQLTTAGVCVCSSIILVIIVVLIVKKSKKPLNKQNTGGLFVPGLGRMGAQQPVVIQMPMQTQPYPFRNSPFPRDT